MSNSTAPPPLPPAWPPAPDSPSYDYGTNCTDKSQLACYDTSVTGQNLIVGLVVNACIGLACYAGFVLFRSRVPIYYNRLQLRGLRFRPPAMRLGGWAQLYSWLVPVFTVSDAELLRSSGLDALVAQRIVGFGCMVLLPMMVLGIGVLLPVNYTSFDGVISNNADYLTSTFLRLTISAVPDGSEVLWLHFAFVYIFVAWVCWLLVLYYKEHVGLLSMLEDGEARERLTGGGDDGARTPLAPGDSEAGGGAESEARPGVQTLANLSPGAEPEPIAGPPPVRPGYAEGRYTLLILDLEEREFSHTPSDRTWAKRMRPGDALPGAQDGGISAPRVLRLPSKLNVERRQDRMAMVGETLEAVFGDDFDRIIPVHDYLKADGLLSQLNSRQGALESAELALGEARAAAKAAAGSGDEETGAAADAGAEPSAAAPDGKGAVLPKPSRVERRVARLEARVAALTEETAALGEALGEARAAAAAGPPQPCFLAAFHSQEAAAFAAGVNLNPGGKSLVHSIPAPDPANINWTAMRRGWRARTVRPLVVKIVIVGIMLIPIGLFSGAAGSITATICNTGQPSGSQTLSSSTTWFCSDDWFAGILRTLVSGVLPSILLMIYQSVLLPRLFYAAAQAESQSFSFTAIEQRMGHWFFLFDVFNVFLGAMLGGSIFSGLRAFIQNPRSIFTILGAAVPSSSNFFVNYVMTQALLMVPFRLFWPHASMLAFILRWLRILPRLRTRRAVAAALPQRNCRYARDVGVMLFTVMIMVSSYSIVSPLILPFGLLYFSLMWCVFRYQMLYVFQDFFYSGGQMWPFFAHRMVACLALMTTFSASMLVIKKVYSAGAILFVTVNTCLWWFSGHLASRFEAVLQRPPITKVQAMPRCTIDPLLYTPPALRPGAQGWHPDHSKAWLGWGMPREGL